MDSIKILFLAAEAEPFIKVGGLADVAGSLPAALRRLRGKSSKPHFLDVRLVLPFHAGLMVEGFKLKSWGEVIVPRKNHSEALELWETMCRDVPVYFLKHPTFSHEQSVYSRDAVMDREKYALFSLACLEIPPLLGWQPDIIHANDWHTALALHVIQNQFAKPGEKKPKTVITIHNLPFMGGEASDILDEFQILKNEDCDLPEWAKTYLLPMGLAAADAIVPVSPTYAKEILTPGYGCGLEEFLRGRGPSVIGILNGRDDEVWDPNCDPLLAENFRYNDLAGRKKNKIKLQHEVGLGEDLSTPIIAMVGRIDQQKGLDIAFAALRLIMDLKWQFILLGKGDPILEKEAMDLQMDFPDRVTAIIRYDSYLGHLIYGGSEMFLMPSRYEPCGLAQMIAMRYGCIPIAHATGGLKDTVISGKTGFPYNINEPKKLAQVLERALRKYTNQAEWHTLQIKAMRRDFSWSLSAQKYDAVYQSLIGL